MARTFVAMAGTANVTVCTRDGTPYRADNGGIIFVQQSHQTEIVARGLSTATAAQLRTSGHGGDSTNWTAENCADHG